MVMLEENLKWHLEAFASEFFIYTVRTLGVNHLIIHGTFTPPRILPFQTFFFPTI